MPLPKKLALVVDDDIFMRTAIKKILTAFDFDIIEAVNGLDGVEKFQEQKDHIFDLVTMDFMMPELNGAEAASQIRALDQDVLIIGLSSSYRRMETECKKLNLIIPVLSKFEMPDVLTNYIRGLYDGRGQQKAEARNSND